MSEKKEIYLLPYAHLDTQWRWEYPTTILKYLPKTLEKNFKLLQKYPGYSFNFTGMIRYAMIKEYYPEQYEVLKDYVELGRWHPAGTCMDETDSIVPCMESMVRNILYGHREAVREFGRSSRDYLLPDCFGFPGNMPTILAHMGIQGFSTQKLTWQSAVGIPFQLGVWKGPDGSGILAAINPGAYMSRLRLPVHKSPGARRRLREQGEKSGVWKTFQYYGVGDMGGAPDEGSVKRALKAIEKKGDISVRQGSPDRFYDGISSDERSKLEIYKGDFLLTLHSAGTLTSAAVMKRWNRKNEQMAFAAEAAAETAHIYAGSTYPSEKIQSAWTRVLGSQMHDILPGTSTPTAYAYAHNDEVLALNLWASVIEDSARAIAPLLDGDGTLLLYNPAACEREDFVEVDLPEDILPGAVSAQVTGSDGAQYSGQIGYGYAGARVLRFCPPLKSLSWQRFKILPAGVEGTPAAPGDSEDYDGVKLNKTRDGFVLENRYIRVSLSPEGVIYSVTGREEGRELLKKPLAYEFQREVPRIFPAWNMSWKDRQKPPFARLEGGDIVKVLEEGPLSCTLEITCSFGDSKFVKEVRLNAGARVVDFTERIRWREMACSLKLSFAGDLKESRLTTNWESCRVHREVNSEKVYEVPSRYWADLSGSDGWGFSLVEDCKYGYDRPDADTLRMTLLYTPGLKPLDAFRDQGSHDWGEHTVRYGLYVHCDGWNGSDRLGRLFNQPVRPFLLEERESEASGRTRSVPDLSLFSPVGDDFGVSAVKRAEEGEGLVVRVYEKRGRESRGRLEFRLKLSRVFRINGLEEPVGEVACGDKGFDFTLDADSLASFLVEFDTVTGDGPSFHETCPQEALSLQYDCRLISPDSVAGEGFFPAELVPSELKSGAVTYRLFPRAPKNTLRCNGQPIGLPAGMNTLSLLCCAEEESEALFLWKDGNGEILKSEEFQIQGCSGFAGQWDKRLWKKAPTHEERQKSSYIWKNSCTGIEKGFIRRDRIELFTTHTHKNGSNLPYQFGYFYTKRIPIPEGAVSLQLPPGSSVYIFGITAFQESVSVENASYMHDKYDC